MATYVILTRFSATAFNELKDIGKLAEKYRAKSRANAPRSNGSTALQRSGALT
jgi:hypothetical protein